MMKMIRTSIWAMWNCMGGVKIVMRLLYSASSEVLLYHSCIYLPVVTSWVLGVKGRKVLYNELIRCALGLHVHEINSL